MKTLIEIKRTAIKEKALSILFFFFICFTVFSQNTKMDDKIDPVFRKIINKAKIRTCPASADKSSHSKSETHNSAALDTTANNKKYDCIVYTENPKILREKGIMVISVLPSFVTASANLCQILQMSQMAEVTKIEAPRIDRAH